MLHVTCLAHGLHRVADFIRSQFNDVNDLISNIKKIFRKVNIFFKLCRFTHILELMHFLMFDSYFTYRLRDEKINSKACSLKFPHHRSRSIRGGAHGLKQPSITQLIFKRSHNFWINVILKKHKVLKMLKRLSLCQA